MGLFDMLSDTKDKMEKSRQAREYIQRAKELVKEGNEIYERAYDKTCAYASETEYRLSKHINYKKEIVKELGGNIDILKDFEKFDIDSKVVLTSTIQESNMGLLNFKTAQNCYVRNPMDMTSIFDFFASDNDYYEARRERDEAKRYKERMKMEREKLNDYKEKMSEIRSFIDLEKTELESLMQKLKKMTDELKCSMQKSQVSMQEAEYLKGIHKIAECIITLLSTEFLNDTFSINEKYQKAFSGIKNINQNLPSSPSVSDKNTINAIKHILDASIVY